MVLVDSDIFKKASDYYYKKFLDYENSIPVYVKNPIFSIYPNGLGEVKIDLKTNMRSYYVNNDIIEELKLKNML